MQKRRNYLNRLYRYSYMKLIVPIKKEREHPEYIARGTAVGLFCGFTPMVWQMNIVLFIWLICRFFKFHFSLPIGLAMTWVSNAFTNIPLLYLYYITGSVIMGHNIGGYDEFTSFFADGVMNGIKLTFIEWGKPIILGSISYMVIFAIIGYFISYRYAVKLQKRRLRKLEKSQTNQQ